MEKYIIREMQVKYKNYKKVKSLKFTQSNDIFKFYRNLINEEREKFITIHLNASNEVMSMSVDSQGGLSSSAVYPEVIFKNILLSGAVGVIFVHNHPSGNPNPSDDDKEITKNLVKGCQLLHIKVLDHIVIGDNKYYSFSDNGLISQYIIEGE